MSRKERKAVTPTGGGAQGSLCHFQVSVECARPEAALNQTEAERATNQAVMKVTSRYSGAKTY